MRLELQTTLFLLLLGLAPTARAYQIHVENPGRCLVKEELQQEIGKLFQAHRAQKRLFVSISDRPTSKGLRIEIRLLDAKTGAIMLDRAIDLPKTDCPRSTKLIQLILSQFLAELPVDLWDEEIPGPVSVIPTEHVRIEQELTALTTLMFLSVNGRAQPWGGDAELGLALDVGADAFRLLGSLALRQSLPSDLGSGKFIESYALLGLGGRYRGEHWMLRFELKTGGLLLTGMDYAKNFHTWMAWLEAQLSILFDLGPVALGPQISVQPFEKTIVADQDQSRQLARFRLGLIITLPFWDRSMP